MARTSTQPHRRFPQGRRASLALAAGALLLLTTPLQAGPIFVPGQLEDGKFVPAAGPTTGYSVRYSTANVTVDEGSTGKDQGRARVQIEEIIDGPEKEVLAVGLIPLPEGYDGDGFRVTLTTPADGLDTREAVLAATFLPARKARETYEAIARALARPSCWPSAVGRPCSCPG